MPLRPRGLREDHRVDLRACNRAISIRIAEGVDDANAIDDGSLADEVTGSDARMGAMTMKRGRA
jgi:hypothetical protein